MTETPRPLPSFAAVVFDIGETLLDRTREYAAWAEFFDVPAHTFSSVFGAMIARGGSVSDVLEFFGGGADTSALFERRAAAAASITIDDRDLYPDARASIRELRALGYVVGIAGNQPSTVSEQLRHLEPGADYIGSSSEWGVSKPSVEFFLRAAREAGASPAATIYVGDQLDNDVLAPLRAGLASVRVLRGPWGYLTRDADAEAGCLAVIHSLAELPKLLGARAQ
jgi:FMN phosphatase YigB (HAD superfamily)